MKTYHPSNKLFNGECETLEDALETMIAAYLHEAEMRRSGDASAADKEFASQLTKEVEDIRAALHEYQFLKENLEKYFGEQWVRRNVPVLRFIGEAVLAEDYSRLAI